VRIAFVGGGFPMIRETRCSLDHPERWPAMGRVGRRFVEEQHDIVDLDARLATLRAARGRPHDLIARPRVARSAERVLRSTRMLRRAALLLVGLPLTLGSGLVACTRPEPPLTLVFTPSRDPTALKEAGDAFAQTLTQVSGVRIRALVASDYAGVIEALRSRRVDLAFVHPVGYVLANREAGCQILVRDVWQGKTAYTARFYVRKDRGIQRVADLRGKTVAFVDPASSSGYIYPMVFLMKEGLVRDRDPKSFFKEALFSGTHEAALQAVLHGRVDAAASFDKAPELHLKDPALVAQLGWVGETPEIPEAGICARPGLPAEPLARIKRALLSIKAPEHAAVLKEIYGIDGFIEASDADYRPVRDAMILMDLRPPK